MSLQGKNSTGRKKQTKKQNKTKKTGDRGTDVHC